MGWDNVPEIVPDLDEDGNAREIKVDFNDMEATVNRLIDMAHDIGKGSKTGDLANLTMEALKAFFPAWVHYMKDASDKEDEAGNICIATTRAVATIMALVVLASARSEHVMDAAEAVAEGFKLDLTRLVKALGPNHFKKKKTADGMYDWMKSNQES